MAKDSDGLFVLVADYKNFRTVVAHTEDQLDTGRMYRFKVTAYNFNGEGDFSDELLTYACVAPSNVPKPSRVSSTTTSFTISWQQPQDDGGCPLTGYAVYRNDGQNGQIDTEVNSPNDSNVRDKPTLRQLTITDYPSSPLGKSFQYQVKAFNIVGASLSNTASYVFAAVAPAPTTGPVNDPLVTSSE